MTLYRTSGDSPIVRALARAAERGKQVTAVVELKARFDEAANIHWARALDEGGVHVVYGLIGLKVHAKMALVIRRCGDELKRYLHIATGNYNPSTARFYTDLGLLTAREDITADAMLLFNVLTGYGDLPPLSRLIVSPFRMRQHFTELIAREAEHARAGRGGRIIAKFNSLVDPGIVRALYRASQAGVEIDLLVRGMCVLRRGCPASARRSGSAPSSTGSSSTPASTTGATAAKRRCTCRAPTGCRVTSTGASRSPFRCSIRRSADVSRTRSWPPSWRTRPPAGPSDPTERTPASRRARPAPPARSRSS